MKILSVEDINAANDTVAVEVEVSEWGGAILVRGMTGGERAEFEEQVSKNLSMKHLKVDLILKCAVDEKGKRIFENKHKQMLLDKSSTAIEKVFDKIFELSGLSPDGEEVAEGN